MMNKKSQVFLIAAVIFILAIYSVVIEYNTIREYAALEDYEEITENYQNEFPKVANKAIYEEVIPVEDAISEFNSKFLKQVRQKDPNYGVLYAYRDTRGILHIVNTLNNKVVNIEFKDPETSEKVNQILMGDNVETRGSITLEGVGSNSVSTDVDGRFGARYENSEDYSADINEITLHVEPEGTTIGPINIMDFTLINYVSSEQELELPRGNARSLIRSATLTST